MKIRVFLSYVHENKAIVAQLADELRRHDIDVWYDKSSLRPGQRWRQKIKSAITAGDYFIACFSRAYAARQKTYMNEELIVAIEQLRLRSNDRTWFIPVLLDDCEIPDRDLGAGESLRDIQAANLYDDWSAGVASVASVLHKRSDTAESENESTAAPTEANRYSGIARQVSRPESAESDDAQVAERVRRADVLAVELERIQQASALPWTRAFSRLEYAIRSGLFHLLLPLPHLPGWVDDAVKTLPALDFFGIFLAIVGLMVAVEVTDQTWLIPVAVWMVPLGLVVSAAHWRAGYLRAQKDVRGATLATLTIVAAFLIFGVPILWPVITHLKANHSEVGTILPFTQGFLGMPLSCGDPACSFTYISRPYTPYIMHSVLDHSLKMSSNGLWGYARQGRGGGNGVIIAFNGERANGARSEHDAACIGGNLRLAPAENVPDMVIHPSPCGSGFASYAESLGYDFRAAMNTPVQAAAEGIAVNHGGARCIVTKIPSADPVSYIGSDQ